MKNIVFEFLTQLQQNNNREWFNENKDYYNNAKNEVQTLFDNIFQELQKIDSFGKARVYRIYRDTRFSEDKTPYKDHFGMNFMRRQPHNRGTFYVHLQPNNVFVGGGFWGPEKDDLLRIRKAIEVEDELEVILNQDNFKKNFGNIEGEALKTAPKGFEKEHPRIELIRLKQFLIRKSFTMEEALSPNFVNQIEETYKQMLPFFEYMTSVLTSDENGEPLF